MGATIKTGQGRAVLRMEIHEPCRQLQALEARTMSGKDDDVDRESYYRDAAETWARGCRGEPLSDKESRRFHGFARDRFYTFLMSANHARTEGDGEKLSSLIRSLAKDLVGSPGLEAKWHESEFSEDEFGQMVSAMLETLRGAPESHACDDE